MIKTIVVAILLSMLHCEDPPCNFIQLCHFIYIGKARVTLKDFGIYSYITCNAAGVSEIISAARASALDALCSPSAAITFALASRAASASAAIARCNCCGRRTSLL